MSSTASTAAVHLCNKRAYGCKLALEIYTSARVGRGFLVILSSICVAQMEGFPARLHLASICLPARNIFSDGISVLHDTKQPTYFSRSACYC